MAHGYIVSYDDDKIAIVEALEGFYKNESEEKVGKDDMDRLLEAMKTTLLY